VNLLNGFVDEAVVRKPVGLHEQDVRDAQGRLRFHGAFTGGFSAGYFNTVGSKEGKMNFCSLRLSLSNTSYIVVKMTDHRHIVLLRIPSSRPSPRTFPQFVRVQVLGFLAAENDGFET